MKKMTGIRLEVLKDIDMHLFVETGVRGGIAMISNRYAKANNPYLSNYDRERENNYFLYLGCTNMYGTAMKQPLQMCIRDRCGVTTTVNWPGCR